jgi:cell shape-determining protein MreC
MNITEREAQLLKSRNEHAIQLLSEQADQVRTLKYRIAELEKENQRLRCELEANCR